MLSSAAHEMLNYAPHANTTLVYITTTQLNIARPPPPLLLGIVSDNGQFISLTAVLGGTAALLQMLLMCVCVLKGQNASPNSTV